MKTITHTRINIYNYYLSLLSITTIELHKVFDEELKCDLHSLLLYRLSPFTIVCPDYPCLPCLPLLTVTPPPVASCTPGESLPRRHKFPTTTSQHFGSLCIKSFSRERDGRGLKTFKEPLPPALPPALAFLQLLLLPHL